MQYEEVVVWVGNDVQDELLLMLLSSIAPSTLKISTVDVTGKIPAHHHGTYAVGMACPESTLSLMPNVLTEKRRERLKVKWRYWRQQGCGWREFDEKRLIVDRPIDYLDDLLVAKVYELNRSSTSRVVGRIYG